MRIPIKTRENFQPMELLANQPLKKWYRYRLKA